MSNHSLVRYIPMRKELCSLAKKGKLDSLKEYREIKMFLKLYKDSGPRCNYLLSVCQVIDMDPEIKAQIEALNE